MGKEKAPVDSDYSGRPLDRPAPDDLDGTDWHEFPIETEGIEYPDGFYLVAGHDDRYYYPGRNGWPDYERGPVDPDDLIDEHSGPPPTDDEQG